MSSAGDQCLKSLSTSNRPPSPQEASVAEEFRQLCDQKLKVVDTRIAALEHALEELKAQRAIIEEEEHRCPDVLSAYRRLPSEIIGRFMELACMEDTESSHNTRTHRQVLSFMLVSRVWYQTACGIAHFWSHLDMDLTKSSAEETRRIIVKAANRRERAAELPLSLNIAFSAALPTNSQIVEFIHSLIPRLGALSLHVQVDFISDLQILDILFRHPPSAGALVWSTLHTLRISIQSEHEITAGSELSIPSASFPLLTTAAISASNSIYTSYHMPWSKLLSLDLGPIHQFEIRQYVSILQECITLRSLRLCMRQQIVPYQHTWSNSDHITNLPLITLPHLTRLHLENTDNQDARMKRLLSLLKLPSLRSCTLTILDNGYGSSILSKLTELFQRSECSESMEYLELNLARGLRIDAARTAFINYLNLRFASSNAPMKAQLSVVDTVATAAIRRSLDTVRNGAGSSLDVLMD
ncbi:hypothetical protein H1R20_g8953, partial [Candolleomyces eurysporus]